MLERKDEGKTEGAQFRRIFARLARDRVVEMIQEASKIEDEWPAEFLKEHCVEITGLDPLPEVGWVKGEDGTLQAPRPVQLSPLRSQRSSLREGVSVKIGGKKTANFASTLADFQRMSSVAQHISLFKEFPGGGETYTWPSDPPTEFKDTDTFLQMFKSLSSWREKWNQHADGNGEAPPGAITIEG